MDLSIVAQEITECENKMLALEKALIDLKYKRMALNTKMNSVSDPTARLPLDITIEIFAIAIDSQDTDDTYSLPVPFLLGRICKMWRNNVWNRPSLWKISEFNSHATYIQTKSVSSNNGWIALALASCLLLSRVVINGNHLNPLLLLS